MLGIPLAAFLHSALQFAHAYSRTVDNHWEFFPVHWAAGVLFGSIILAPAFTIQAYVSVWLSRRHRSTGLQILAGALTQAALVALWAKFVGIEPSLSGNFSLSEPMIGAAFLAAGSVAMFAAPKSVARPERHRRVFGYGSLRAFMNLAAMISLGGASSWRSYCARRFVKPRSHSARVPLLPCSAGGALI